MILERLQPDDSQRDAILLVNLSHKDEESVALLHHLLSKVRENYMQLSSWEFLPVRLPLPDLELWGYWLAAELVAKWRDRALSVSEIDEFLASLQTWFSQQCPKEPIFAPLLKQYLEQKVDLLKLLGDIEATVDCPLQKWHSLNWTQTESLRKEILIKLQPVCVEVYVECYQCLLDLDRSEISTKIS